MATRKKKNVTEEATIETPVVEEKPVDKPAKKNHVKITYPGVNIRSEANLRASVLTIAYEKDKFELAQDELVDGFYKIKYENGFAYVMADFVKLV